MISFFEMLLCYIVIMMLCWFIEDRRAKVLIATLTCVLVLSSAFSIRSIKNDRTHKLVVYHISGKKAIAFIMQRQVYYDFDTGVINNETLMRYNIKDHWWQCGVEKEICADSAKLGYELPYGKLFAMDRKRVIVIDKELRYSRATKLKADVVILSGNTKNTIDEISQQIDFNEVVFDTSNKPVRIKHWMEECEKMKIRYYDCRDKAFEMDI